MTDGPPFDPQKQAAIYRAKIEALRVFRFEAKANRDQHLIRITTEMIARFELTIRRLGWIPKNRGLWA